MNTIAIKNANGEIKYMAVEGNGTLEDPYIPVHREGTVDKMPFYRNMWQETLITNDSMNVDGSITPVKFLVKPEPGKIIKMARLIVVIIDGGDFDSGGWGNSGNNPLPNGLALTWKKNGVDIPVSARPITSHAELAAVCHDMSYQDWGQGDKFITVRFTFTKAGQYLVLDGDEGDELSVLVQDDLTYLSDMRISMQGYYDVNGLQ